MDLSTLIAECTAYDYKSMLEEKKPKSWLKSVSAFANGKGCSLFFGIDNDGSVRGIDDVQHVCESISTRISDYMDPLPDVEIRIEPSHVEILSFSGPDRSISQRSIAKGKKLVARRYRNRILGEYLKQLGLTEGWATGIPTIQRKLQTYGSSPAIIETDEDRSYFLISIPCREGFDGPNLNGQHPKKLDMEEQLVQVGEQVLEQVNILVNQCTIPNKAQLVQVLGHVMNKSWTSANLKLDITTLTALSINTSCLLESKPSPAKHLLQSFGLKESNRLLYKRLVLDALLNEDVIEMTVPDKPRSKNQAYVLTAEGTRLFN